MLEVGVNSWSMQSTYMRPRAHELLYREALEDARLAEALGYDSFWMGEHHFTYDGYSPSLIASAAHILAATDRIKLGSAVLLLPLHGPARVAEACAAANSVSENRLCMSVAAGWRGLEFDGSGLRLADRARLMDDYVEALVDGDQAERFGATELWMGGTAPPVLRRAGRFGASVMLNFGAADVIRAHKAIWRENMRPNPKHPPRAAMIRDIWVDDNPRRLEWIRHRMREPWRFYAVDVAGAAGEAVGAAAGDNQDFEKNIDAFMQHTTLGDPAQALDELAPIVRDGGLDALILRVRFDGIEPREVRRCLELIADCVVPELKRL